MAQTTFEGRIRSGTKWNTPLSSTVTEQVNVGDVVLTQRVTVGFNGSTAVDGILYVPANSRIIEFMVDVTTAFNSATSNTLSIGTASGGTQYASGVDVKTAAGRIAITHTAAQLLNMQNTSTNVAVYCTQTPVGSASAGVVTITMKYVQTT